MRAARFCDDCGISLDLHDGDDSCEWAESRAEAIEAVERMFWGALR